MATRRHRSRDHLIPRSHFLYMLYWHQVRISNRRRGNGPQIYWGHDLDLFGSRDVIIHVTIRIPMGLFPLVVHWTQVSISIRFQDIGPKYVDARP